MTDNNNNQVTIFLGMVFNSIILGANIISSGNHEKVIKICESEFVIHEKCRYDWSMSGLVFLTSDQQKKLLFSQCDRKRTKNNCSIEKLHFMNTEMQIKVNRGTKKNTNN